eukprot:Pgem_evm1s2377
MKELSSNFFKFAAKAYPPLPGSKKSKVIDSNLSANINHKTKTASDIIWLKGNLTRKSRKQQSLWVTVNCMVKGARFLVFETSSTKPSSVIELKNCRINLLHQSFLARPNCFQ